MAIPTLEAWDSRQTTSFSRRNAGIATMNGDSLPSFLTVLEVADMLRVSRMTAYRLTRSGALASCRFGGCIRVPETALREYMEKASTRQPGSGP